MLDNSGRIMCRFWKRITMNRESFRIIESPLDDYEEEEEDKLYWHNE
jgi:hypothetical protein